jgi:Asp/Glu/hydantoin racemase
MMTMMTYHVALAFMRSGDDGGEIVACDPKEARSSEQAIRMANSLAKREGHCGAIAFSRAGDPAVGDFDDALILKVVGEVDIGLLSI